jgi:60 kDa SS-A/Ro ribonucleoprotein
MRLNVFPKTYPATHEGGPSTNIPPLAQLRRLTMACMLWEDTFYVDGKTVADQIAEVCTKVKAQDLVNLAIEIHQKGLLRHIPLFLIVEALKKKAKCIDAIDIICNRPDQMTELLTLYWKKGRCPIAKQLQKGLAKAFPKFDEYQLQKYNRDTPVKLRDVLFLSHAKPKDDAQKELWQRLITDTMATPETWETKLSAGEDKKESFEELLTQGKMGKLALIRNLRNMREAGVPKELVRANLLKKSRPILPFQFIAAAKMVPQWEDIIDEGMIKTMEEHEKFDGFTILLVDVSGSMQSKVSSKSEMTHQDAAAGLAILVRSITKEGLICTFSDRLVSIPARNGMALRDAIKNSQPNSGTALGHALTELNTHYNKVAQAKRIIIITDEQSSDKIPHVPIENCYVINTGAYQQGINNNGQWLTISGFSENTINYILEVEKSKARDDKNISDYSWAE